MIQIAKKLNIAVHQLQRVRFMWYLRFLFQVGFVFAWTIVTAIFIDIFTIDNILWLLLGDAVLFLFGSFFANYFFLKTKNNSFLSTAVLGSIILVCIATIFRHIPLVFFTAALLAKDLFFSQLGIAILRKNESLFSPKEAQKIMPILESSLTIGTIVSAILFLWLLDFFPTETLLAFWLIPLMGIFILIVTEKNILKEIPVLHKENIKVSNNILKNFSVIKRVPFLKLMTLVVLLQAALFSMVEFEFIKSVKEHAKPHTEVSKMINTKHLQTNVFRDALPKIKEVGHEIVQTATEIKSKVFVHDTVAHDLGFLSLVFGVLTLIVQLFFNSKFLERIGIINTMGVYFAGFLGMITLVVFGGFSMSYLRGFQHGFHSLFEAPYHLSFYSIKERHRESVRHFFEGFVKPVGVIFAVLLLLVLKYYDNHISVIMMAVFAGILLGLIILLKSRFTHTSQKNLQSSQNISAKLHAVEVLAQKGHGEKGVLILADELLQKNTHPIVQEKIIKTISQINNPKAVHAYLELLGDKKLNRETKIQILESLLKLKKLRTYWEEHAFSQHHLLRVLSEIFEETNHSHTRKLVVMNIFAHLPTHKVAPYFLETLKQEDPELQAICLRSAAEVFDDPEMGYYVREYLEGKDSKLKGYAIIALWKFEDKIFLSEIIESLLIENKESKIAAIYAIGEIKGQQWKSQLFEFIHSKDEELRLHALVALTKLGEEAAIPDILNILFGRDESLARKLFFMLKRVPKEQQDIIKNEIQHEVSQRVLEVLMSQKVTHRDHLKRLSKDVKQYLKYLYRLGEKYDDLVAMEGV